MSDIITPPAGNFTPGAEFSIGTIAAIINAAWSKASEKQAQFEAKVANATSGWLDSLAAPSMTPSVAPDVPVVEPVVSIPETASQADIMDAFDTKYLELVALLADKFTAFRTAYFPNEAAAYAAAEGWLQQAVADGGIPDTIRNQILADDTARILAEAARAESEFVASFAAKRYPLPAGALAAATLQIQQKAQEQISETSRKFAIATLEQMRFAVDKLLANRTAAMSAAIEYIKALASGPDMASRVVNIGYDAQSKLISAASSFYNARIEAKKLEAGIRQGNADREQESNKANLQSELTLIDDKLKALLTEAQTLAQMATAMLNNIHASAGTRYEVNGT